MNGTSTQSAISNQAANNPFADNHSWKELNQDEKVERTRNIVRTLLQKIELLQQQLNEAREQLTQHHHNQQGEAVVTKRLVERKPTLNDSPQPVTPSYKNQGIWPDGPDVYF